MLREEKQAAAARELEMLGKRLADVRLSEKDLLRRVKAAAVAARAPGVELETRRICALAGISPDTLNRWVHQTSSRA